jgi:hypothetical protein
MEVMFNMRRQLIRRIRVMDNRRALSNLFLWMPLLVFFGCAGGSAAAHPAVQNPPINAPGAGLPFAIADFDGDLRPDLASIQNGYNNSGTTDYWIQLQLSTVGRQAIRLVAPSGGLRIEARDVNGDHALDLVLTTAWFNQPVAVLLNNGRGIFSQVEPSAFPGAFSKSRTNWVSAWMQAIDIVGVPPQSRASLCLEPKAALHRKSPASSISTSNEGLLVSRFLTSHAGRAPPSEVPHS